VFENTFDKKLANFTKYATIMTALVAGLATVYNPVIGCLLALFAGTGLVLLNAAYAVYQFVEDRKAHKRRLDRIAQQDRQAHAMWMQDFRQGNVMRFEPDAEGLYGIAFDGQQFRNLDTGEVFTLAETQQLDAMRQQMAEMATMFRALRGVTNTSVEHVLQQADSPAVVVKLPKRISLQMVCSKYGITPGYEQLVLGEGLSADGTELVPVVFSMLEAVHLLVSSASGFGKSVLLEALCYQLLCEGDVDVCCVDYGVNTFGRFVDHLLYPIADTPQTAIMLFDTLYGMMQDRRAAFAEYPEVKNLAQYNKAAGTDERSVVCFVDESASLFRKDGTAEAATEIAQMGRKYGIHMVCAGTDFKADTLPSEASGNFGGRVAFYLRPSLSLSLLYCKDASLLRMKGRGLAMLPGVSDFVKFQAVILDDVAGLPTPREQMLYIPKQVEETFDDKVVRLYDGGQGMSVTGIAKMLLNNDGGNQLKRVKGVLRQAGYRFD